jgi:hypothetical protein
VLQWPLLYGFVEGGSIYVLLLPAAQEARYYGTGQFVFVFVWRMAHGTL